MRYRKYVDWCRTQTEIDRTSTEREKTGVPTGAFAINPVNGEKIPVWVSDYVLLTYGTGIVMAVPGHDERDFAFARKFNLPIREVIAPPDGAQGELSEAYTEPGVMMNSAEFDGMDSVEGKKGVVAKLSKMGKGDFKVNYKLRDWLISRQRYWGVPIPIIHCENCGEVPVPEDQLPVELPAEVDLRPTGGVSPLATNDSWVNASCPKCGKPARREVDTMDTFVDSSWYFLRYLTPKAADKPFDRELVDKWLPVDHYVGGAEHATMHLIYARFINMVLFDLGLIGHEEPFKRLSHQGTVTNQGAKMSKSRGNVINPEKYLERFGSDVFRCYIMFMGSYEHGGDWDDTGIQGMDRFIRRVWRLVAHNADKINGVDTSSLDISKLGSTEKEIIRTVHNSIKGATEDIERLQFNTSLSRIMELINALIPYAGEEVTSDSIDYKVVAAGVDALVKLLAPFAPHICEEMWRGLLGNDKSVFLKNWPEYDPAALVKNEITVVIQINGKLRSELNVPRDIERGEIEKLALADEKAQKYIDGLTVRKVIYVPGKLVNIVAN